MKKRVESGDYKVCAAHDLAPVFEKVFGVKPRELVTNSRFQELLITFGLNLGDGEEFVGVSTVRALPKNKKGRKGRK